LAAAATSNDGKETATPTRGAVLEAKMIAAEEKKNISSCKKRTSSCQKGS